MHKTLSVKCGDDAMRIIREYCDSKGLKFGHYIGSLLEIESRRIRHELSVPEDQAAGLRKMMEG